MAERVFVDKMIRVGFENPDIRQRRRFGLDDARRYPLFTPDVVRLMEQLLSPEQQDEVAVAVTVTAQKPFE